MADDDVIFAEMDAFADSLPMSSTFWADVQIEFRQLQKGCSPDLTEEQWLAWFERWRDHYRARQEGKQRAVDIETAELFAERDNLLAQIKFPPSRRAAHGRRAAVVQN